MKTPESATTLKDLEDFLLDEIEAQFPLDAHAAVQLVGAIQDALKRAAEIGT